MTIGVRIGPVTISIKEEIGAAEVAGAVTIASIAAALIFNYGFFSQSEWSFVSLLSIQDLVLGTIGALAIAILIISLLNNYFQTRSALLKLGDIDGKKKPPISNLFIGLVIAWIVILIALYIAPLPGAPLVFAVVVVGGLIAIVSHYGSTILMESGGVMLLAYCLIFVVAAPFVIGNSMYRSRVFEHPAKNATIELESQTAVFVSALVLRLSSDYVFLYDGKHVSALPLDKVKQISVPTE